MTIADTMPAAEAARQRDIEDERYWRLIEGRPPPLKETEPMPTHPCPGGCGSQVTDPGRYCPACAAFHKRPGPGKRAGAAAPQPAAETRKSGPSLEAAPRPRYKCPNPDGNPRCAGTTSTKGGLCRSCGIRRAKGQAAAPRSVARAPHALLPARHVRPRAKAPPTALAPIVARPAPTRSHSGGCAPAGPPNHVALAVAEDLLREFPADGRLDARLRLERGRLQLRVDFGVQSAGSELGQEACRDTRES